MLRANSARGPAWLISDHAISACTAAMISSLVQGRLVITYGAESSSPISGAA